MKTLFLLICACATMCSAQEEFYKKFAFTKVMAECLGGNIYYGYLREVANARRACEADGLFTHPRTPIPNFFSPNSFNVPRVTTVIPTTLSPRVATFGTPGIRTISRGSPSFPPFASATTNRPPLFGVTSNAPPLFGVASNAPPLFGVTSTSPPLFGGTSNFPSVLGGPSNSPSIFEDNSINSFLGGTSDSSSVLTTNPDFSPDIPFGPRLPSFRQKRALIYTAEDIQDAKMRVEAMIGNFTCLLRRLRVVNDNLDIDYQGLHQNTLKLPVPQELRNDLASSIGHCREQISCLPLDQRRSPVPHQLQRLIAFVKCEKEARFTACLKQDLRRDLHRFNLNSLPRFTPGSDDAETLLSLIVGAESAYEMELI